MRLRRLGLAPAAVLAASAAAAVLALPARTGHATHVVTVDVDEHARTIAALKPPKRARPVIAIVGDNVGTETTDYLVPYGVLRQADVADVLALAMERGPLRLMPALTVQPNATTAEFDARYAEGADYVVVPALHHADDPAVRAWIRAQSARGATIIGVCSGVQVLAHAGLLDGRAATGHWYDISGLRKDHPSMRWVRDRRYVVDRGVMTTTGITASMPASLALVEAIAGRDRAAQVARTLGIPDWDEGHASDAFRLDRGQVWTAARNTLAFWSHETVGVPVEDGIDEIALALTADAYSRTYRSQAKTIAATPRTLTTRRGLQLLPDRAGSGSRSALMLPPLPRDEPARALAAALAGIAGRYGPRTAAFVALQLEYPWGGPPPPAR